MRLATKGEQKNSPKSKNMKLFSTEYPPQLSLNKPIHSPASLHCYSSCCVLDSNRYIILWNMFLNQFTTGVYIILKCMCYFIMRNVHRGPLYVRYIRFGGIKFLGIYRSSLLAQSRGYAHMPKARKG